MSCGQTMIGLYCHHCGEKKVHPKHDYSVIEFIEQTLDGFTHLDSKFIRSFKYLLFNPGLLSKEYKIGRRVKLMRPIQVFIITTVMFYFFMPRSSSFYESLPELKQGYSSSYLNPGNPFKYNVDAKLEKIARTGSDTTKATLLKSKNAIYERIDEKAAAMSKTWLFLVVPVWGLFLFALFYRQNHYFVPHLVFTMHLFSFFLIADLFSLFILFDILHYAVIKTTVHLLPFLLLMEVYIVVAVRKFNNQSWLKAVWKGTLSFLVLLVLLMFYRAIITTIAVYLS